MAHGPGVRANRYMLLYRLYLVVADRHWIPFRICHVATVHRHSTCLLRLDPPVRVRASHRYTERAQSDTQARAQHKQSMRMRRQVTWGAGIGPFRYMLSRRNYC